MGCILGRFVGISHVFSQSRGSYVSRCVYSVVIISITGCSEEFSKGFLLADGSWIPKARKHCNLFFLLLIIFQIPVLFAM